MWFEIIEADFDTLLQLFIGYIGYTFYVTFSATREKVFAVVSIIYAIIFVVLLRYLIRHHYLGLPFDYSELLHETLFLIAAGILAWALLSRKGWRQQLKQLKESNESQYKKTA